ncbi:MAG: cyclic nucleotide-binding domain-containing protein, partial [Bdellovibrionales bacterium]|nr:cyclic nucleotide-binding domain-containing protein [Bdellovibrionales bacterium]
MAGALEASLSELLGFSIFEGLSKEQILELCQGGQILTSSHRDVLFPFGREAHFFGIVLSGAYKLTKPSPLGEDVIVHFSTPGDVLAAFIMTQPKPRFPVSAISMGPSRFLKIPKEN